MDSPKPITRKIKALNGNTFEDYGSGITVTYPGTCGDGSN
jgi:hypothetical protein